MKNEETDLFVVVPFYGFFNLRSNLTGKLDAHAGQLGIEALRDYAAMLAKVFKYDLPFEY